MDHTKVEDNKQNPQEENQQEGMEQEQPVKKKNRFIFRNLNADQRKQLSSASAGAFLGGIGAFPFASLVSNNQTEEVEPPSLEANPAPDPLPEPVIIYTDAPFAESVTNDMSFNEAFATARREVGAGGFFEWRGNTYNTYYKEEWDALSSSEQDQFMASVHNSTDYESAEVVSEEAIADNGLDVVDGQATEIVDASSETYGVDTNSDGDPDMVGLDVDGDGFLDVIAADTDFDSAPDAYFLDTDNDDVIDTLAVDPEQDGLDGNEIIQGLENPFSQPVEDFVEEGVEMPEVEEADDPLSIAEDLPDIDNDSPIDDFA